MSERKENILNAVSYLAINFIYYDRKEDEDLPRGQIQEAIKAGEITVDEIVARFRAGLE